MSVKIIQGDCRDCLPLLPVGSVHCCVTSPPYWGLRNYGVEGQIGLEETPEKYVRWLVKIFRQIHRVLRDDGTLWLNLGDKIRKKNLLGLPWRVALALQADGWILRSDIIWHKSSHLPESVKDRPTRGHEYIFLLAKQRKYYYDIDATREPHKEQSLKRYKYKSHSALDPNATESQQRRYASFTNSDRTGDSMNMDGRNLRSVWTICPQGLKGAHFAVFPPKLIEPCILAGCPPGGVVLDPFAGAFTTALVAEKLDRDCIGIELNPEYCNLGRSRLEKKEKMVLLHEKPYPPVDLFLA